MSVLKEMALRSTSRFGKRAKLKETAACSRRDMWTLSGAGAAGAAGLAPQQDLWGGRTCFTPRLHTSRKREKGTSVKISVPVASHGGRSPALLRPLPARPQGPSYLDWAPSEAVDSVRIRTGFQELLHSVHLPPRGGVGQARAVAATTEHALVLLAHFAVHRRRLARIIHHWL